MKLTNTYLMIDVIRKRGVRERDPKAIAIADMLTEALQADCEAAETIIKVQPFEPSKNVLHATTHS